MLGCSFNEFKCLKSVSRPLQLFTATKSRTMCTFLCMHAYTVSYLYVHYKPSSSPWSKNYNILSVQQIFKVTQKHG